MYGLIVPAGVAREVAEALERFVEYAAPYIAGEMQETFNEIMEEVTEERVSGWIEGSLQQFLCDGEASNGRQ